MVFKPVMNKVFGTKNERELKRLWPVVETINQLEDKYAALSEQELQGQTVIFKERLERGEPLDDLLPETFAVVREASKRTLGMRHFDVQLIGGMVLHEGRIAEMKTGEGKTLCATLPVYLNALTGRGVHLVTVNDYLASRDAEWMAKIYNYLGLSVGVIVNGMDYHDRKAAYQSDITYGQNNEFGFDYLRDNMKVEMAEKVQRSHYYSIVDEVDSILVDEARTPLIISGPAEDSTEAYLAANTIIPQLERDVHYTVEEKEKQVMLVEDGVKRIEELLGVDNLYEPANIQTLHHVNQGLRAHIIFKRDIDYVVRGGEVIIVDEFTGRLMAGRRWSDGQHQAIEAKEGVKIQRENQTLATITFQNYFRMYDKLSGMTGTADTEAVEFQKIYGLDVVVIPTNEPMVREDNADVVFATERGKYNAVCDEIEELHEIGQPILVGTANIHHSEKLGKLLEKRNVPHHVLNAKHHEHEADIVAQAGRMGAVTISTNMAGRGTDIVLGGNPEFLAADVAGTKEPEDAEFQAQFEHFTKACAEERSQVLEAGGLHILGTERHESRRIDNQLRGRAGRQGDPGSSRFYVSLEDDLMRRFGGERMQAIMARVGLREEDAIEGALVGRAIENAQKKVEGYHFEIRKHLLEYDDVLNKQREVIYELREKILKGEEVEKEVLDMIPEVVEDMVLLRASEKEAVVKWDIKAAFVDFFRQFGLELEQESYLEKQQEAGLELAQQMYEHFRDEALQKYELRKAHVGAEGMLHFQRIIYLQAIDHYWREHLTNMDHLREGVRLMGYAQKNPLHEYQKEGYELFRSMMFAIKQTILQNVFMTELPSEQEMREMEEREREEQRRREAAAKTVHEDVVDVPEKGEEHDDSGLNRRQRRRQTQPSAPEDYAPNVPLQQSTGGKKKKAARKKAKKSRRKNR